MLASVAPDSIHAIPNNPPAFAPPCLQISGAGRDGSDLLIHQTPTILEYLARELNFGPGDEAGKAWVSQIALTALDFANETHDVHHPIAASLYYEGMSCFSTRYPLFMCPPLLLIPLLEKCVKKRKELKEWL